MDTPARDSLEQLRDQYAPVRQARQRTLLSICIGLACFVATGGPRWFAFHQRDFVRSQLGISPRRFRAWLRMGRLFHAHPRLREEFLTGHLSASVVDLLGATVQSFEQLDAAMLLVRDKGYREAKSILSEWKAIDAASHLTAASIPYAQGESLSPASSDTQSPGDPSYQRAEFRLPTPVSMYAQETLELARGLIGHEATDEECAKATLGEACTEVELTIGEHEAQNRFRVLPRSRPTSDVVTGRAEGAAFPPAPTPPPSEDRQRRAAHVLDRYLLRQLARFNSIETDNGDRLLDLLADDAHQKAGFYNFERFAQDVLDIPASTVWDHIRQARMRRASHPIAIARANGEVTAVQSDMLQRLHRQVHIPTSALPQWIQQARMMTTRRFRAAVGWARRQRDLDYRSWSNQGFPPPTDAQLRTSLRSLEEIVQDPDPADMHEWKSAPMSTLSLVLETETLNLLLRLMGSIQDRAQRSDPADPDLDWSYSKPQIPDWLALFQVCYLARKSWAIHYDEQCVASIRRRILSRDGWRCQTPECSERKSLQVHHIDYGDNKRDDADENRLGMCGFHHLIGEHTHLLRVRGKAGEATASGLGWNSSLRWEMGIDLKGRPALIYQGEWVVKPAPRSSALPAPAHLGRESKPNSLASDGEEPGLGPQG